MSELHIQWQILLAQTISFSIVLFVLWRFAYRPIFSMLEARRQKIAEGMADAEKSKAELAKTQADRKAVLAQAGDQANELIEEARIAAARKIVHDPRIVVTGLEADIGTRYTFDTVQYLALRARSVKFVWLMGADNLAQFSRWQRWADIAALTPIAAIDRPGATRAAFASRAAQRFSRWRIAESNARLLPDLPAPAFVFLHDRRIDLSSTLLRRNGNLTEG